ncbi:receptor-like protein kinase FERONIA [Rutidosis leptorrhynchoides]|uniref:receptor-like protein kinase FERONIA n=1 Tax=Rutidosis leptorrhynchoides TaxID=125765 RepID=UPI003A997EA5
MSYYHFILVCIHFVLSVNGNLPAPYYPTEDIAVNCGSSGNSSALDGREWTGDVGPEFGLSRKQAGNSMSTRAVHTSLSGDPVPYLTARASHSPFFYTFQVQPGPKFIRLHFNPAFYIGFETSIDFFTVQAGSYKLLHNFSASLTARSLGVISFSKEFCVSVEYGQQLTINISPSYSNAYAFVNGIEIISMPSGLYYTPADEPGANVVNPQKYKFYIDNNTALETVHRLNIGGSSVSPIEDTGMYRRWSKDSDYHLEKNKNFQVYHATSMIKYTNISTFLAPLKVYQTSWSTRSSYIKKSTSFTWRLPVDLGFRYLMRLHFCQHEPVTKSKISHNEFEIMFNDQIVEKNVDIAKWAGGYGVAVYKDYVVPMRGDKRNGKVDLSIVMYSNNGLIEGKLNGLEVFKLSNPDDSLAGSNPYIERKKSSSWMPKFPALGTLNAIATKLIVLITALNIIVYIQRWFWEEKLGKKKNMTSSSQSQSSSDDSCRCFSISEILAATRNFDKSMVIGMGGFAKVYKGVIDDGKRTVAIKRMSSRSHEGALEFWMEIQMIWRLRHNHLVSLIGYCDDGTEMILVYEYMPNGTLAEHLFRLGGTDSRNFPPLSWDQRVKICIGAARGLDYLHTGTNHGVIHRDVKTSNILVDENFVGKISDFGLSKVENTTQMLVKSYVSTNIKGTVGYLDPDYFLSRKLSRKSDVYAFGVVLFEVLCGRPAVDPGLEEEQRSLAIWARQSIREGKLDQIIDPCLQGEISRRCLNVFTELAEKCLENLPKRRPSMASVISGLEFALELQEKGDWVLPEESTMSYSQRSDQQFLTSPKETTNSSKKSLKPKRLKSWRWDLLWNGVKSTKTDSFVSISSSKTYEDYCRKFLLSEIQAATNDFDENLIVGTGDFSIVYKGYIDSGNKVVIMKRFKKFMIENWSKKTDFSSDFCKEIEMLSQLRNPNLVSLIGYCYQKTEIILVYEHMVNGSLRSHLYDSQNANPMTWNQRLQICIDAAQGLEYLQTGCGSSILHRDVNPGNILLDEKWVAKVSDYGLSKVGPLYAVSDNLTAVLGNCLGYLDPECMFANGTNPTDKSDVYSFGLVLLEVLCGRKLEDHTLKRDQVFLRSWVKSNVTRGTLQKVIDPTLKGKIVTESLKGFIKIAQQCLADKSTERPSMGDVIKSLKLAAQYQESAKSNYSNSVSKKM